MSSLLLLQDLLEQRPLFCGQFFSAIEQLHQELFARTVEDSFHEVGDKRARNIIERTSRAIEKWSLIVGRFKKTFVDEDTHKVGDSHVGSVNAATCQHFASFCGGHLITLPEQVHNFKFPFGEFRLLGSDHKELQASMRILCNQIWLLECNSMLRKVAIAVPQIQFIDSREASDLRKTEEYRARMWRKLEVSKGKQPIRAAAKTREAAIPTHYHLGVSLAFFRIPRFL
jgi:hypothetical protein